MATPADILTAGGLTNAPAITAAADTAGIPLEIAAALIEKESGGRNIYGHDAGGIFSTPGRDIEVTRDNFVEFLRRVLAGERSNGVGPAQVTWAGYFRQDPSYPWWDPYFNILYGLKILAGYLRADHSDASVNQAGQRYNSGSPTGAPAYGADLVAKANRWHTRLATATDSPKETVMPTTTQLALAKWMTDRIGRFKYSMDMTKRWPVGEYADCSSLVRAAYQQVAGIEIGTYTGDQQRYGRPVFGAEVESLDEAISRLQPGDLVFYDWDGHDVAIFDHVDMYIGDGRVCGHGGPGPGPIILTLKSQWDAAHTITARRYVTAETTATPEEGEPMSQATLDLIAQRLLVIADAVTDGKEGVKFDGDVIARLRSIESKLDALATTTEPERAEPEPATPAETAPVTGATAIREALATARAALSIIEANL